MKGLVLIWTIIITMSVACSQIPGYEGTPMNNVEEIKSEYYSNYPEPGEIQKEITSQRVFEAEWNRVHEGMSPLPEVPSLNFEDREVILLMLDTKPSGGYGIDNLQVNENDTQIIVRYSEVRPGESCFTTQALTRPYKIFSIPQTEKEIQYLKSDPIVNECN